MSSANAPQPEDARGCILVVDDEDALRRAVTRRLRAEGYAVVEADHGAAALDELEAHAVDVVLSDITMPDMDGVELLRRVREAKPDVPVLLMTGEPHLETAVKAIEYGAFEYIAKPFDLTKLCASVARASREHRAAVARRHALDSAVRSKSSGPRSVAASAQIAEGTLLADKYRVVRLLGSGGMGTVYEAVREDLARMPVAIKVLHAKLAGRPELLKRFRREAELIATVHHPNIVTIVDFVLDDAGPSFLVMELLEGFTLAQAIAKEAFSERRCAFVVSQMLDALAAAHAANIIHRDLKPENVFLTRVANISDVVKLLDFGIAKVVSDDATTKLTDTGTVLGTPAYMAPEYARGEKSDARGDIYSIGCVMYEALAKRQPFVAANYNALLFALQDKEPDDLRSLRPDVTVEMSNVIRRAMSKNPDDRFPSARSMREALAPWVADVQHPSGKKA
jgi:DNA-binding response OmpR family regulator